MSIEQWWARLQPATRQWLMDNNGDVIPAAMMGEIAEAGGRADRRRFMVGQAERNLRTPFSRRSCRLG
ncbi:hypothetical protein ACX80W_04395 [Arthrobacter sp. TMN-37]